MADELIQTLGFDASPALAELKAIDAAFGTFQQTLNTTAGSFSTFNTGAGALVSTLKEITSAAKDVSNALGSVGKAKLPTVGGNNPLTASGPSAANAAAFNALFQNSPAPNIQNTTTAINANAAAAQKGIAGVSGYAVSLETLSRVLSTQLIVRGLNAVKSGVEDSIGGFIAFDKKIQEIRTITDEPVQSLASNLSNLSNAFNVPIIDVATAKYQALSNGFTTASENSQVLESALAFSKVGISSATQGVDLISTALNAYGKSADEAANLTAKLFKTIDLGRVVGSELTNSFGRVAPIAHEVGVSTDEVLAAFSSITVGGVKASEAATQIRGALTALLKPSEDMKAALKALGAESAQDVVEAKGFHGALEALIGTTNGSTEAIAKLFPNVRALSGVLREVGTGSDEFNRHLQEISITASDTLTKKLDEFASSPAQKLEADFNRIKNLFTTDIGKGIVEELAQLSGAVGGIDNLTAAIKAAVFSLGAAAAGFTAFSIAAAVIRTATTPAAASLTGLAAAGANAQRAIGALTLAFAAYEVGTAIGASITNKLNEELNSTLDIAERNIKAARDQADARNTIDRAANVQKFQAIADEGLAFSKLLITQEDQAKASSGVLVTNARETLNKIVGAYERAAQDEKKLAQASDNDITNSRKRSIDVQNTLSDQQFAFQNRRFNDRAQLFRSEQRATDLASQGRRILSTASTPQEKEAANSAFQRAEAYAKQALSTAENGRNLADQVKAERVLEGVARARLAGEAAFRQNRAQDTKRLAEQSAEDSRSATVLKNATKLFLEKTSVTDKKGNLLDPDTLKKNAGDAQNLLDAIFKKVSADTKRFSLSDIVNFSSLQQRINEGVSPIEIRQLTATPGAIQGLVNQITKGTAGIDIFKENAPDPSKFKNLSGKEAAAEFKRQSDEQRELLEKQQNADKERIENNARIAESAKVVSVAFEKASTEGNSAGRAIAFAFRSVTEADTAEAKVDALTQKVKFLKDNISNVTPKNIQDVLDEINKVDQNNPKFTQQRISNLAATTAALKTQQEALARNRQLDQQGLTPQATKKTQSDIDRRAAAAPELKSLLDSLDQEAQKNFAVEKATQDVAKGYADDAEAVVRIIQLLDTAKQKTDDLNAARAASSGEGDSGTGGGEGHSFGGNIGYFAAGGNVGGDTQPAMLTKGEFVVNESDSRKWFSQLSAINAGQTPDFNNGGTSNNVHISGGITINESANPQATVRELMKQVRRETRRGSSLN